MRSPLLGIARGKQVDAVFFDELVVGIFVHVDADGQYGYAFILHAALHFDERRHLFDARCTPRRPEVEDYDLSVQLTERDVFYGEIGRSRTDTGRTSAAIAA